MKKIRFIINPKSGATDKHSYEEWINSTIDKTVFNSEITHTSAPHHATELAKDAAKNNYDIVVAVGGDGSVNETGAGLIGTKTALGIIPTGSGNGMARHMKIPLDFKAKAFITREDYYQMQRYLNAANLELGIIVNFRPYQLSYKRVLNSSYSGYSDKNSGH